MARPKRLCAGIQKEGAICVYAIGWKGGPVKIGKAADISGRLIGLQVSCPYELEILAIRWFDTAAEASKVERTAHANLTDKRLRGEWFDVDVERATAEIEKSVSVVASGEKVPIKKGWNSWIRPRKTMLAYDLKELGYFPD